MASHAAAIRVRRAEPADRAAIVQVVAARSDTPLAEWLFGTYHAGETDPHYLLADAVAVAGDAVRVVTADGEIVGAALWNPDRSVRLTAERDDTATCDGGCAERIRQILVLGEARRPAQPHHQLTVIGVRPQLRRRGLASYLLIDHHAFLHVHQLGSYVVTDDSPRRELLLRHGYTDIGPAQLLAGGVPVWSMWRPPGPAA